MGPWVTALGRKVNMQPTLPLREQTLSLSPVSMAAVTALCHPQLWLAQILALARPRRALVTPQEGSGQLLPMPGSASGSLHKACNKRAGFLGHDCLSQWLSTFAIPGPFRTRLQQENDLRAPSDCVINHERVVGTP